MSGDKLNVRVSSWYKTNGSSPGTPVNPISDLLVTLINGVSTAAGGKATGTELTNSGVFTPGVTDFLTNRSVTASKPKAYLNWILFDEQFKLVSSSSGAEQVGDDQEFKVHVKTNLPVTKNGYLYVYVSNETPNINVYFDNLQVTHIRGPLLEETHYYPFGLTMSGISSKSAGSLTNKYKYNGKELNNNEFSGGSGLEWYDYGWRLYDAQLGRFFVQDAYAEKYDYLSLYQYTSNNPVNSIDVTGDSIRVMGDSKNNLDFWEALGHLLETKDGKALWNKYAGSSKHDLYIGLNDFKSEDEDGSPSNAVAATVKNVKITDGKIDLSRSSQETKDNFSSFNFYSGLKFHYAKRFHIDTAGIPVPVIDQREWKVPKNSPYYKIRKQLIDIKNAKKGK